ncbi:hypothetical protein BASA62_009882 [Batrachochytrium salamandrivorans]|nr:hypothetical protein BASA62_009882 [Batrachochytrium salamandrivorans]
MTLKRGTYTMFLGSVFAQKVGGRGRHVWKRRALRPRGTTPSADLGGSSNYSRNPVNIPERRPLGGRLRGNATRLRHGGMGTEKSRLFFLTASSQPRNSFAESMGRAVGKARALVASAFGGPMTPLENRRAYPSLEVLPTRRRTQNRLRFPR